VSCLTTYWQQITLDQILDIVDVLCIGSMGMHGSAGDDEAAADLRGMPLIDITQVAWRSRTETLCPSIYPG
jgi:hypothetical protein